MLYAALAGFSRDIQSLMTWSTFNIPGKGPYVEVYITVFGKSVVQKKIKSGKLQGEVEVSLLFKQNDSIKAFRKYNLAGPESPDTNSIANFIDQQRIALAEGVYKMEFNISDKNKKDGKPFMGEVEVTVSFRNDVVSISDIELVESWKKAEVDGPLTKSGYDILPYVSNYFPENLNKLSIYAEIYNAKKILGEGEKFLINYYFENYVSRMKLNSYNKFSTQVAGNVNICLSEFNITDLPTGSYNLVLEIRDKTNTYVTERKIFFRRNNPKAKVDLPDVASADIKGTFAEKITNKDTMVDYIKALRPVSSEIEKIYAENQVVKADLETMQKYLYTFWYNRNQANPEAEWVAYLQDVKYVLKNFGAGALKGYDTDRGRVYLQYGPPGERTRSENEPTAYPYEVWHYYKMKDQTNRKFVFYNPDLVTNNFILLHSDAKGERYDSRWQMKLHQRTFHSSDYDIEKPGMDMYGDKTNENFSNPK